MTTDKKLSKISTMLIGLLLLSGCAQKLISGNEVGGMVSGGDNVFESRAGAMQLADEHCQKYGKVSRVSGQDPWAGTLTFDCVKP